MFQGLVWPLTLIRPQRDSRHHFKMTTVIGAQGQAVADRRAGNEQVTVTDGPAQFPQSSPLLSEQIANSSSMGDQ